MKTKIAITVDSEMLAAIDKIAEGLDMTRSQFIQNLLSIGLADAQVLKAAGLLDLARLVVRTKDELDRRLSRDKAKKEMV